jgi:hypothetical protein
MLRKSIYRSTALTLAFLIFFTSVGFSFDVHYCKGQLKGISILGEAKSCHTVKKVCPNHAGMQLEQDEDRDCCSNKTLEFEDLDSDYNIASDLVFSDLEFKFLASFAYAFVLLDAPISTEYQSFKAPPPLITRDIYVLNEAFLL